MEIVMGLPLFELLLNSKTSLLPLHGVLDGFLVDNVLVERNIDGVTRRHQVAVVANLQKQTNLFDHIS